jgi:NTP pyrophosphatase (non-canonical NTP hydrolase)
MSLNDLRDQAHKNSCEKGWWDDQVTPGTATMQVVNKYRVARGQEPLAYEFALASHKVAKNIPEKLCLIHSEVSEALEDYRDGNLQADYEGSKPVGFPSEMADILIRVFDLAGALGIDLDKAVAEKMAYNRTRPHRHGGKTC